MNGIGLESFSFFLFGRPISAFTDSFGLPLLLDLTGKTTLPRFTAEVDGTGSGSEVVGIILIWRSGNGSGSVVTGVDGIGSGSVVEVNRSGSSSEVDGKIAKIPWTSKIHIFE